MALKLALIFLNIVLLVILLDGVRKVTAHHYMCEQHQPQGTLTVWAHPSFDKYGVTYEDIKEAVDYWPQLTLVGGNWWDADVLITGVGLPYTYVHTACAADYTQRGSNVAVVHIGPDIRHYLTHELGHALGYADHLAPHQQRSGHINPGPCLPGHIMSYC